jgi:transposase
MQRYELTDGQFELIRPLLPRRFGRGGEWADHRRVLNGILWVLFSGAPWRDLPERYGPFQTAHGRLTKFRKSGLWGRLLAKLQLTADGRGLLDPAQWNADTTSIRATRAAGGAKKGASTRPRPTSGRRWG